LPADATQLSAAGQTADGTRNMRMRDDWRVSLEKRIQPDARKN
jgi:hypothetical protein